jgi:hypothetical protein
VHQLPDGWVPHVEPVSSHVEGESVPAVCRCLPADLVFAFHEQDRFRRHVQCSAETGQTDADDHYGMGHVPRSPPILRVMRRYIGLVRVWPCDQRVADRQCVQAAAQEGPHRVRRGVHDRLVGQVE